MHIKKLIKTYSEYRANGEIALSPEHLQKIYDSSTPEEQREYEQEMNMYIQAVKNKEIKAGDSYVLKVVNDIRNGK